MQPDMPHDLQEARFHRAIWHSDSAPDGITAPDPSEAARRFSVYRNTIHSGLSRALEARFPVTAQLVGAAFFAQMARVFSGRFPPQSPVLLHWGAEFPDFLAQFPPVAHLPYLPCVARIEYLRGLSYHAADAKPVAPEVLRRPDPAALRLRLHPSVQLFSSAFPAVQIWQAHQPGAPRLSLGSGPDRALIARAPDFAVFVMPVDAGSFAVLSALQSGLALGDAAMRADPTQALALLLRHGLIIEALTGEHP